MDGTVRVWNLQTGECQHTLTGHTSLVGLLGLSPSTLVSAAADSTLRIWDSDTGELRHTLAAHTGAITCFQHDEFKVLSGSDGTLKMWNVRDGTVVRDLLTGITGVWQVVFEGRWCVAASNRNDATVLDVWDFGNGDEEEWIGEVAGGLYDEDADAESEDGSDHGDNDNDAAQTDTDAMDQDRQTTLSETDNEINVDDEESIVPPESDDEDQGVKGSRWAPGKHRAGASSSQTSLNFLTASTLKPAAAATRTRRASGSTLAPLAGMDIRALPANDDTPTKPRLRAPPARRR